MPRRAPVVTLVCALGLVSALAGCRTSPRAARPAAPAQTSIAFTDPSPRSIAWTTPLVPEASRIARSGGSGEVPVFGRAGGSPGTELERRFQGGAEAGPWQFLTTWHSTYVMGGGFDVGGDAPDLWINRFRLSVEKPTGNYARFGAFGSYVNRSYTWDGSTNPLIPSSSNPFDSVHTFRVGVNHWQPLSENWAAFLMVTGSWSATDTSDLSDAFSWSVSGMIGRRITPRFDLGIGMVVGKLFEDSLYVIAGPQFGWRPRPYFNVALEGTQLDFNYTPPGPWEFGVSGAFIISRFRLDDAAPQSSQIVQDWRLPIWARARYRCIRNLDMELRLGLDAYRVWSIEDEFGDNSRSYASDPAPMIGFRLIWRL